MMRKEPRQFPLKSPCDQVMDAEDAFKQPSKIVWRWMELLARQITTTLLLATMQKTKITNEILTEEELKEVTDNDEEKSTAVNSETTLRSIAPGNGRWRRL